MNISTQRAIHTRTHTHTQNTNTATSRLVKKVNLKKNLCLTDQDSFTFEKRQQNFQQLVATTSAKDNKLVTSQQCS